MPNNMFGQMGGQPGMGQPGMGGMSGPMQAMQPPPQMGQKMGGPPQMGGPPPGQPPGPQQPPGAQQQPRPGQGQSMPANPFGQPQQEWSPQTTPWDSAVRAAEQALMQAQMNGMPPSQIGQLQLNLQNAQADAQSAEQSRAQGQRQRYLEEMQRANQTGSSGPGIGGAPGQPSSLQQDPFLAQLLANQYGQGFNSGGGIRS